MHHASIRTADIHRAIAFYQRLGFVLEERFTTGATLACWMTGLGGRIELIQIPQPRPAADAFGDEHYTGYYHLSFDLTAVTTSLPRWLTELRSRFKAEAGAVDGTAEGAANGGTDGAGALRILLEPEQQQIGDGLYEVAFIADADGLPLEFIRVIHHGG